MSGTQKISGYVLATVLIVILLGSALAAPTFSAYAQKGKPRDDSPNNTPVTPKNNTQNNEDHDWDDHHKKIKKDPDHDGDNDHKKCKHGDKNPRGKYRHNCDSDHDFIK